MLLSQRTSSCFPVRRLPRVTAASVGLYRVASWRLRPDGAHEPLEDAMSLDHPILNCKVPESLKAAWQLTCQRQGITPGVRLRGLVERETLADRALECARTVGFEETMRRLALPTYPVHALESTSEPSAAQGKPRITGAGREHGRAKGDTMNDLIGLNG